MRTALSFLTVLPIRRAHSAPGRAALLAFPLAGVTIGGLWAGVAWAGTQAWGPLAAAALVVAADLVATGALHVDAVADVADGVASRRPPQEAIAIMRDPAVGAVGAAAAAATLLLRFVWIAALASAGLWLALVAIPVCGRAAMVVVLAAGRRPAAPSLACAVGAGATPGLAAAVVAQTAALAGLAGLAAGGLRVAALGVGAAVAAVLAALATERAWRACFGPVTGDCAGAAGMGAEVVALAVLALGPGVGGA